MKYRIKLIDKYEFSKIIEIPKKYPKVNYLTSVGMISFHLFDLPKKGLPIFRQIV